MKRPLNLEQSDYVQNSVFPLTEEVPERPGKEMMENEWSYIEDEVLKSLAAKEHFKKWLSVARQMNSQFKHTKRSAGQCQARWDFLSLEKGADWDCNEEVLLLYALYFTDDLESVVPLLRTKNIDQIRKHMNACIKNCIDLSLETPGYTPCSPTPLEVWKSFFYSNLLLRCLAGECGRFQDLASEVMSSRISEDAILSFLERVGKAAGVVQKWTVDGVNEYVNNVMERLENELYGTEAKWSMKPEDSLEGHNTAQAEQMPQQQRDPNVFVIFTIVQQANT